MRFCLSAVRKFSSNPAMVVYPAGKNGVARICLSSPPVNSMTKGFFQGFINAMDTIEDSSSAKSLVIHSSCRVFSAGLDLKVVANASVDELMEFWALFQSVLRRVYTSKLLTVAAVDGHALAGGCILSMCSDFRVMNAKAKIGLNETMFGLLPPDFFGHVMKDLVGHREAERALTLGTSFSADDALRIGLTDKVLQDGVLEEATRMAESFTRGVALPSDAVTTHADIPARAAMKMRIRKPIDDIYFGTPHAREVDAKFFIDTTQRPEVKKMVQAYLASLSKK